MNKIKILALMVLVLSLLSLKGLLNAANDTLPPNVTPEIIAKGRELFNTKAGLKVKFECILCHKQDKAIKKSDLQKAGDKLPTVINKYIMGKAKGPALASDSEEMKALIAYIQYEHSK